jgi:hypothetical protein
MFSMNRHFNPTEKTLLVDALDKMTGVEDRRLFIRAAARADEEAVALYMRVRAQMMAVYSKRNPVERFVDVGGVPYLLTKKGRIVGVAALDHILWTERLSKVERAVSKAIGDMDAVQIKEIRFTGTLNKAALAALESRGWQVEDRIQGKLFK